jgi:hypothetical protein
MEENKRLEDTQIAAMGARELFLETLTKMGIKYSSSSAEDFIWFDYLDVDLEAEEDKDDRYITLEYMYLRDLHNAEEATRMRRIINKVNCKSNVVISCTVKFIKFRRKILFIEEIPNIEDYLRAELQEVIRAYELFNEELQKELSKDNNTEESDSYDIFSTQTKDLFIKTITEMGCDYEKWENDYSSFESIVFDYQTEKYRATFFEHSRKVLIENHVSLYNVELSDMEKVNQLREVVNKVNQEHDAVTVYTIDCVTNKMYAEASHTVPFMAEIPNLLTYLHSILNDLYLVRMDIKCEMEADEIEEQWIMDREAN